MGNAGESFLASVDTTYRKTVWKAERPRDVNWVTPVVRTAGKKTEVLFDGPKGLVAYDADTGEKRWSYKDSRGTIPTAAVAGDMLYLPIGGLTAVKLTDTGVTGEPAWKARDMQGSMASPLIYNGK